MHVNMNDEIIHAPKPLATAVMRTLDWGRLSLVLLEFMTVEAGLFPVSLYTARKSTFERPLLFLVHS